MDNSILQKEQGSGWEEFLKKLGDCFYVPKAGTQEYKSLTESFSSELKEWQYKNPPKASQSVNNSSTTNYPSQKHRYESLLAQIDSDKICSYTVNGLTDRILDITVDTKNKTGLRLIVVYKPYCNPPCYTIRANDKEVNELTYEEILDLFKMAAVISDTDLCESTIAEDFKLYENLWD
jgi:hypothetical protein